MSKKCVEIGEQAVYNGCATPCLYTTFDNTMPAKIFHPLLALIASATDREEYWRT
jgi:hypothetical protein